MTSSTIRVYVALAVLATVGIGLAALVFRRGANLTPAHGSAFDLDEPTPMTLSRASDAH